MTDETKVAPPSTDGAPASMVSTIYAVKELRDEVAGLKSQLKGLWVTVIVVAVLLAVTASLTLLPRLFGFSVLGGGAFRGQGNFNRGQMQQGAPGNQGGQTAPGATTPGQ